MSRKKVLVIVGIVLLALITGVASFAQKTELTYWTGFVGPDAKRMEIIVEQWNSKHPDIKVNQIGYTWTNLLNKLVLSVAAGNPPDVGIMHVPEVGEFAARGCLEPLDEYVVELGINENDFLPTAWNGTVYEGTRYAIPLDVHPLALFYNLDMFRQAGLPDIAPANREEYVEYAQKLTKRDTKGDFTQVGMTVAADWRTFLRWYGLLYQAGGSALTAGQKKAAFSGTAGVRAAQFLHDLIYKYEVCPPRFENQEQNFVKQKAAMTITGPWWIVPLKEQKEFAVGIAEVPQVFENKGVWGSGHVIFLGRQRKKNLDRTKLAVEFVKHLSDNSMVWVQGGQVPCRISQLLSQEFAEMTEWHPFAREVPYTKFFPLHPKSGQIFAHTGLLVRVAVEKVLLNEEDPQTALSKAAEETNKILAE